MRSTKMKTLSSLLVLALVMSFQVESFARGFEPVRVSRSEWNARPARSSELSIDRRNKYQFMIGHHGATARAIGTKADKIIARSIQDYHMGSPNNWADIGYHTMVGRNGTLLDGRDLYAEPVCNRDYNSGSICAVFLGCFDRSCNPPNEVTNSMIFAMGKIIGELAYLLRIPHLGRHNILGISELGNRYPNSPGSLIMERNATGHIQIDVIAALAQKELARKYANARDDL